MGVKLWALGSRLSVSLMLSFAEADRKGVHAK